MKLLYIQHTSTLSGAGKALLNIIEQMIKKDVEIHVVLPDTPGSLYNHLEELEVRYSKLPVTAWVWPSLNEIRDYCLFPCRLIKKIWNSWFFYKKLDELVRELRPDIIHTNVGVIHIGHFVARKHKIPHVWHMREYQDLDFNYKAFPSRRRFKKILTESHCFPIAITQGVYNHHHLYNNSNARIIYDGVIEQDTLPIINFNKQKYFLFVGSISKGKGTLEAVCSFIKIAKEYPEFELWIAGTGTKRYLNFLKHYINQSDIHNQVKILGYRNDVYQLMTDAMALIVPSMFEGFGFITTEAMYNGCLVIGKDTAGTKEQFDNGLKYAKMEIGIRYHSENELSTEMSRICSAGIEQYFTVLKTAQKLVAKLYTTKKNADNLFDFYKKILNKHGE